MWDYNRDGVIDEKDDDEYWADEYFQEQEEHREELEETGVDTLLMDDDEILENWENLGGGSFRPYAAEKTSRSMLYSPKPSVKIPGTPSKQSRQKIGIGRALLGGFVIMVLFSALFHIDVSAMSSMGFGVMYILFCVIWAVIRNYILK